MSKVLQEAYQKTKDKIVELGKIQRVWTVFEDRVFRFFRNPKYNAAERIGKFGHTCFRVNLD